LLEYLTVDSVVSVPCIVTFVNSMNCKWQSIPSLEFSLETVFREMDFVSGFPTTLVNHLALVVPRTINEIEKGGR
jgi:hypothetical protein